MVAVVFYAYPPFRHLYKFSIDLVSTNPIVNTQLTPETQALCINDVMNMYPMMESISRPIIKVNPVINKTNVTRAMQIETKKTNLVNYNIRILMLLSVS
jgi:hypothetical protein